MSERVTRTHRGAMGGAEWHTQCDGRCRITHPPAVYVWFGPGSGLYLVLGDSLMRIEHPAASGTYGTSAAARRGLDAFLAFVPAQEENP